MKNLFVKSITLLFIKFFLLISSSGATTPTLQMLIQVKENFSKYAVPPSLQEAAHHSAHTLLQAIIAFADAVQAHKNDIHFVLVSEDKHTLQSHQQTLATYKNFLNESMIPLVGTRTFVNEAKQPHYRLDKKVSQEFMDLLQNGSSLMGNKPFCSTALQEQSGWFKDCLDEALQKNSLAPLERLYIIWAISNAIIKEDKDIMKNSIALFPASERETFIKALEHAGSIIYNTLAHKDKNYFLFSRTLDFLSIAQNPTNNLYQRIAAAFTCLATLKSIIHYQEQEKIKKLHELLLKTLKELGNECERDTKETELFAQTYYLEKDSVIKEGFKSLQDMVLAKAALIPWSETSNFDEDRTLIAKSVWQETAAAYLSFLKDHLYGNKPLPSLFKELEDLLRKHQHTS